MRKLPIETKQKLVNALVKKFGQGAIITKKQLNDVAEKLGVTPFWYYAPGRVAGQRGKILVDARFANDKISLTVDKKVKKGIKRMKSIPDKMPKDIKVALNTYIPGIVPENTNPKLVVNKNELKINDETFKDNLIPKKNPLYTPFGFASSMKQIVASKMFYPVMVTGLSGNGKTMMVQQACAATKREMVRVNCTVETDEDDLIGGFRLVDGATIFFKGPVIRAMEMGAVLLLDEFDLANPAKIMCLQSILEGSGYFIKKTGEYITPMEGFNIIATANTKGKGSDDGRFIGTNIMNEAFLERFTITVEQVYPNEKIEKSILNDLCVSLDMSECGEFVEQLVSWAAMTRKAFDQGAIDELISTRRLVHIINTYKIFGNRVESIKLCLNRFDNATKEAFNDLWDKLVGTNDSPAVAFNGGTNSMVSTGPMT